MIATNARLVKASAKRLAVMAQDGLARSIRPVHTPLDGDTVFAIATGKHELDDTPVALAELDDQVIGDELGDEVGDGDAGEAGGTGEVGSADASRAVERLQDERAVVTARVLGERLRARSQDATGGVSGGGRRRHDLLVKRTNKQSARRNLRGSTYFTAPEVSPPMRCFSIRANRMTIHARSSARGRQGNRGAEFSPPGSIWAFI